MRIIAVVAQMRVCCQLLVVCVLYIVLGIISVAHLCMFSLEVFPHCRCCRMCSTHQFMFRTWPTRLASAQLTERNTVFTSTSVQLLGLVLVVVGIIVS